MDDVWKSGAIPGGPGIGCAASMSAVDGEPALDEDSRICGACAGGDPFLGARIGADGAVAFCSLCHAETAILPLWAISDIVHELFKQYAHRAEDRYDFSEDHMRPIDGGRPPLELLEETLGIAYDVAVVMVDDLARRHGRDMHHDPGDDWYDTTCEAFILRPTESNSATYAWDVFVEQVRHHGRFFNEAARDYLGELFGPLLRGELHQGTPPLVRLGSADSKYREIYRGRVANTPAEQAKIYEDPRRHLSPPPKGLRRANRMNAEGVPAFYGALDVETCVAELRPMVHGRVVVGKFTFVQSVEVLDLRLVDNAVPKLSWFDPEFSDKYAAGAFIRNLHDIMRVPVFPDADPLEYLPTQVIAEYLASHGVQGVLYVSSLVDREVPEQEAGFIRLRDIDDDGVNVVLFSRSALVLGKPDEIEWEVVDVGLPPDNGFLNVQYVERKPAEHQHPYVEEYPLVDDALEPTLDLVDDSLIISVVKGIKHDLINGKVDFYQRGDQAPDALLGF